MATFTAIKNTAQSSSTLRRALDYVKQEKKTLWEERKLVTGWNCVAQSAYDEMMATKRQFGKTDGRMFYQFVQSFDPVENVMPQEVHVIGLELAQKLFPEFEVVVATHVDADHLHNHLIVNSVSCETGRKLHQNAADLQRQRQVSDAICEAHGLTVLKPPQKHIQDKKMRPGEFRSAVRGESWKFRLMVTIDLCMRKAKTRAEFIREMERRGYQVRWESTRQCITYTTPKGKKCRDNRLHEDKYRKEVMEREFRLREEMLYRRIEEAESATRGDAAISFLSHRGAVDTPDAYPERSIPFAGDDAIYDGNDDYTVREADEGDSGDSPEARTGWEEERAVAFSATDPSSPAQAGMAVGHPDPGGVIRAVAALGHTLERGQAPAPTAPVTGRSDRKALSQERKKKIDLGHKADDHEEQKQDMTLSM